MNLAAIYYGQARYDKDQNASFKVFELRLMVLGEIHQDTIQNMLELATRYYTQGWCSGVGELRREVLGNKHPDIGNL